MRKIIYLLSMATLMACDGRGPFNSVEPCQGIEIPEPPNWHEFTFCIVKPTFITNGTQNYSDLIVGDLNISEVFPYTTDSVRLYTDFGLVRPIEWSFGNGYGGGGSWQTQKERFLDPANVTNFIGIDQDTTFYLYLNDSDTDTLDIRYKIKQDECNNYIFDYIQFLHNGNEMPGYKPSSEIHYIYFVKP